MHALPNLLYTNGVRWVFYRNTQKLYDIEIAKIENNKVVVIGNFDELQTFLIEFIAQTPITITSTSHLATYMAGKANLIKEIMVLYAN